MPTVERVFQSVYSGVDTPLVIGGPGASASRTYTLTEPVSGSTDYTIADIGPPSGGGPGQISAVGFSGAGNNTTFNIVKIAPGFYAGSGGGVYAFEGYDAFPTHADLSWSGKDLTVAWHVWGVEELASIGLPARDDYAVQVQFLDLWFDVVRPDGGGGGTSPPPAQAERALTGLSCNWHRIEEAGDVVRHALGRKAHVSWAWAGWSARPVLMDELRRSVQVEDGRATVATRRRDTWRVLTQPGTTVEGEPLFAGWDGGEWDAAQWAA